MFNDRGVGWFIMFAKFLAYFPFITLLFLDIPFCLFEGGAMAVVSFFLGLSLHFLAVPTGTGEPHVDARRSSIAE